MQTTQLQVPDRELPLRPSSEFDGRDPASLLPPTPNLVDISVLVPAHNEEVTITACVEGAVRTLDRRRLRFEIIVIDDGSTDATGARALAAAQNDGGRIRVMRRYSRFGKGAALRDGAASAKGTIVVILDADMEYAPEELTRVVEPIIEGRCDVVFGSRFIGDHDGMKISHFLGNRILTKATNTLYHGQLTDVMTGYKAFRLSAFNGLKVDDGGFGFEVEAAARALQAGLEIEEVPISYHRRSAGQSKIHWVDGLRCLLRLFQMKWFDREA